MATHQEENPKTPKNLSRPGVNYFKKTALIACHNARNSTWGQASELPKNGIIRWRRDGGEMDLRLHDITEKKAGVREGSGYQIG